MNLTWTQENWWSFWFSNWRTGKTTAKDTNHIEWQKSLCTVCICFLRASCKMTTAHCMLSVFQTLLTKLLLYAAFFCANFNQRRLYQSRQGDEKFASDSRHASSTSNFVSVDADGNETLKRAIWLGSSRRATLVLFAASATKPFSHCHFHSTPQTSKW